MFTVDFHLLSLVCISFVFPIIAHVKCWPVDWQDKIDLNMDDYQLALQLQMELNETESNHGGLSNNNEVGISLVDNKWELLDPNPDARALFLEFNATYFYGRLSGVEVRWSPRMTL